MVKIIDTRSRRRARVRRLADPVALGERVLAKAREQGEPVIVGGHCGTVPNAYDYPALTDAYLVVAFPSGEVCVWLDEVAANKATQGGAVAAAGSPEVRPLFDGRYGAEKKAQARAWTLAQAASVLGVAS
jgi:hypothetical protein